MDLLNPFKIIGEFFNLTDFVPLWMRIILIYIPIGFVGLYFFIKFFSIATSCFYGLELPEKEKKEENALNSGVTSMVDQLIQDPKKLKKNQITTDLFVEQKEKEDMLLNKKYKFAVKTEAPTLAESFIKLNYTRGTKALQKLETERKSLELILSTNTEDSLINIDKIKELTGDIYNQGINLLKQVAVIANQGNSGNLEELNNENDELQEELKNCDKSKTLYGIIEQRISINTDNIQKIKKNNDRLDELINQTGLCIDSLRGITLSLPELINHKAQDDFDKVLMELNTRIEFAKKVKDEYIKQGV